MAYFNHAFKKTFLATGEDLSGVTITLADGTTTTASTSGGFLTTSGIPTYGLNQLSTAGISANGDYSSGYVGWFTSSNVSAGTPEYNTCCPLYLAGSTIYCKDKISPFIGGYQETNKSKIVNPKYVSRFYDVEPCLPSNNVVHVGSTYWTAGTAVATLDGGSLVGGTTYTDGDICSVTGGTGDGLVVQVSTAGAPGPVTGVQIVSPGKGYTVGDTVTIACGTGDASIDVATLIPAGTDSLTNSGGASCCQEFLCGETYYLRLDVKGSPALRFLDHNAYYIASAYTGCCPAGAIAPTAVDSTEVMILWANDLLRSPIVSPFIQIAVQDEAGVIWYAPGTSAAFLAAEGADTWDNYVSPGHTAGACAGMILNGAYVDTKFGDCTFQISDFYEKQPVNLYPSEVDLNGDPCTFSGLCIVNECRGSQVMGLGETALRDLILSESYRQNFFSSHFRIREITQGNQIVNAINRNGLYYNIYLQHSVPRFNNPSGTFDNDQYLLEVMFYGLGATPAAQAAAAIINGTPFYAQTAAWLGNCGVCEIEHFQCGSTCSAIAFPALPAQCGI